MVAGRCSRENAQRLLHLIVSPSGNTRLKSAAALDHSADAEDSAHKVPEPFGNDDS